MSIEGYTLRNYGTKRSISLYVVSILFSYLWYERYIRHVSPVFVMENGVWLLTISVKVVGIVNHKALV